MPTAWFQATFRGGPTSLARIFSSRRFDWTAPPCFWPTIGRRHGLSWASRRTPQIVSWWFDTILSTVPSCIRFALRSPCVRFTSIMTCFASCNDQHPGKSRWRCTLPRTDDLTETGHNIIRTTKPLPRRPHDPASAQRSRPSTERQCQQQPRRR
jgi:hypothetical protein